MKHTRVLHVTHTARGGVAVVVEQLAKGLDRSRYEPLVLFDMCRNRSMEKSLSECRIKLLTLTNDDNGDGPTTDRTAEKRDIRIWVKDRLGKRAGNIYFTLKASYNFLRLQAPKILKYVRIIRENQIDLVHSHQGLRHGQAVIVAATLSRTPCVVHNHGYPELSSFDTFLSKLVNTFIYISRDQAHYHTAWLKIRAPGKIIYNGVDISEFSRPYDGTQVRREFGFGSETNLVGIVGRIDWWKGHEYFLEAMAQVAHSIPDAKGLIIGDLVKNVVPKQNLRYFEKLQSLVKSLDLKDKILFTGFRQDVPRLISALDVVVHASSEPEPFGLVVIEGMAAGKPVVATAAGGILDIIEDGVNGLLVPRKDSKAMAQAILRILSDRDKAEKMALAARAHVREKFTVQKQVTAVQNLYDSILGVPPC